MKLPKKYRGHGLHVYCNTCDRVRTDSNCKHKKIFKSRIYNPLKTKPTVFAKSYPGVTDPEVAWRLHNEFKEKLKAENYRQVKSTRQVRPNDLRGCLRMWIDFLVDIDVHERKKKRLSKSYIKSRTLHIKRFLSVVKKAYVYDVDESDIDKYCDVIPGGNRSYNDHINTFKFFYSWLIKKRGYQIDNPFEDIKNKPEVYEPEILTDEDIKSLFSVVTYDNGFQETSQGKTINLFRPWVVPSFKLALFIGERLDGVFLLEWQHVKENYIYIPNFKVSRKSGVEKFRVAPITSDLAGLLAELSTSSLEGYLIAPGYRNRDTLKSLGSKAFTHFWRKTGIDKKVSFKHLRKTYVTRLEAIESGITANIGVHSQERTRVNHYVNKEAATNKLLDIKLYDI